MKILYLILASDEFPYLDLRERGLKTTWLTRLSEDDKAIQLFSRKTLGKSHSIREDFLTKNGTKIYGKREIEEIHCKKGDNWTFRTYNGWDSILHKTLSAINYALNECKFDYLVRTSPTNLWNPKELRRKLLVSDIGVGTFGTKRKLWERDYIEGSNIVMDRDTASKLVNSIDLFNFGLIDDVAIGEVLTKLRIPMVDWPRPRVERVWDFHDLRYGDFSQVYTFRCRSSFPYNKKVLEREIKVLRKLHKLLLRTKNY